MLHAQKHQTEKGTVIEAVVVDEERCTIGQNLQAVANNRGLSAQCLQQQLLKQFHRSCSRADCRGQNTCSTHAHY